MGSGRDLAEVQARAFDRTSDLAAVSTPPDGTLVNVSTLAYEVAREILTGMLEVTESPGARTTVEVWIPPDRGGAR